MQTHAHGAGGLAISDLLAVLAIVAAIGVYVIAAHRLRSDGVAWSRLRDGCALAAGAGLVVAVSAPLAGGDFLAHMGRHLIVGMLVPLLIVLALPGTLALRTLRGARRRTVLAVLHWRPLSWLLIPPVAALVNTGSTVVLYRTPLLAAARADPWLDGLVHVHLLATGVLFTVAVCQLDPLRRRYPLALRAATVVAAAAAHGVLAKTLYAAPPPNTTFDVADLQAGARLMYYGGDVVEIAVAIVLAMTWYAAGGRELERARRRPADQADSRIRSGTAGPASNGPGPAGGFRARVGGDGCGPAAGRRCR